MNGEVEDISPEDFMVIGELDHLIMMLDGAADGESDDDESTES